MTSSLFAISLSARACQVESERISSRNETRERDETTDGDYFEVVLRLRMLSESMVDLVVAFLEDIPSLSELVDLKLMLQDGKEGRDLASRVELTTSVPPSPPVRHNSSSPFLLGAIKGRFNAPSLLFPTLPLAF